MYRGGLDRFKKAQSLEPFSVSQNNNVKPAASKPVVVPPAQVINKQSLQIPAYLQSQPHGAAATEIEAASQEKPVTQIGGGQSTWQPPDWAIEPRSGVYYLDVMKDGEVLDRINLDKRKHIFGRQLPTCDFVLDHQSVSRQHAAVVPHSNGSVFVIDMGSVHGTFVANERLTKDNPVELEVGQSLRFAASTRTYILRKNAAVLPTQALPSEVNLPSPPDPSDEDAVVAYNTLLNRYGLTRPDISSNCDKSSGSVENLRPTKKRRKSRVAFRDQVGGSLVEIVGISDGADVETEPGPIGVKEGSLVGRYESLVQVTVIPKGKEQASAKEDAPHRGVTEKLQKVLNKVRSSKGGIYDDLYGDSIATKVGSSWAYKSDAETAPPKTADKNPSNFSNVKYNASSAEDDDDLFGD